MFCSNSLPVDQKENDYDDYYDPDADRSYAFSYAEDAPKVNVEEAVSSEEEQTKINSQESKIYSIILWVWPFLQFILVFGSLAVIYNSSNFSIFEAIFLMVSLGIVTGAIGITFAHESVSYTHLTLPTNREV